MRITARGMGIIVLLVMFGGIAASTAAGFWQTETTKVPVTYKEGAAAGQYNPDDIRGSYTFGDISSLFNVPLEELKTAFLPEQAGDITDLKVKELETIYAESPVEIGTDSVRIFVALYRGLPITLDEETYFPASAVSVLQEQASLTAEQTAYLDGHTAGGSAQASGQEPTPIPQPTVENVPAAQPTVSPTEHTVPDRLVRGKTTFQELLDWGVPQAAIEQIVGGPFGAPGTAIKDYCSAKSLEFSTVKDALQAEVDKARP